MTIRTIAAGASIGGFRLGAKIGEGAMGSVFVCTNSSADRRLAIKVLNPLLASDDRFRQRFLREANLAAHVDDPHIVPVLEAGEDDGHLFLVMEYIGGADLRELLRDEGPLEPERALPLIEQVAGALDAAHRVGLVHRDVKPPNILIARATEDERAYVCDFGLARHAASARSLTGDHSFVGTIDYIAPEQIEGSQVDGRADVYSLGCVLFECLAGARPFAGESDLSVLFAHLNEAPPRLSSFRPDLPEAFDSVFAAALAKAPEDRFSTCTELVHSAQAASAGHTFVRRRRTTRRYLAVALAVLALMGAALAGILVARDGSPAQPPAAITQEAIAGARLGLRQAAYEQRFGGYRPQTLTEPGYVGLAFQDPKVAVYFPSPKGRAIIITTWNSEYRTARGVGPCSTLADLKRAYGDEVKPAKFGTGPGVIWSYTLGQNLLFAVRPDTEVVATVALYDGSAANVLESGGTQAYANYVAQVEASCTP